MFEGDSVTLMCRAKAEKVDTAWKTRTLYKNGNVLMDLDENSNFHIEHAGLKDNGEYHCTESETHCCSVSSNTIKIQVQGKPFIICEKGSWEGRSLRWLRERMVGWDITEPQGSFLQESEKEQECFELKSVGLVSEPLFARSSHGNCRRAVLLSRVAPGLTALGPVVILLSRAVSTSRAEGQPLLGHPREPSDPDL